MKEDEIDWATVPYTERNPVLIGVEEESGDNAFPFFVRITLQFPEDAIDDLVDPFKLSFSIPDWKEEYGIAFKTEEARNIFIKMLHMRKFTLRHKTKKIGIFKKIHKYTIYFPKNYILDLPKQELPVAKC